MQVEPRPVIPGQCFPVIIDGLKQRTRRILPVLRFNQKGKPARQIGILQGDARDIAVVQIFERIHCGRIDPAGTSWHDNDQQRTLKPALPLKFLQGQGRPLVNGLGTVQPDIDAHRIKRRLAPKFAYGFGFRAGRNEGPALPAERIPADQRSRSAGHGWACR
ncbi:hypothetical protein D3C73_906330 [compost metagenome]